MKLRVATAQFFDVSSKTFLIEPTEHLVKLFAQHDSNQRHRKLLKLNRFAKHTTEGFGGFGIGELAASYLKF